MDCFGKAQNAAEESRYKKAEEKVKLAVMGSYGTDGNLDDELLKENVNNIDGLEEKVEDASNRPLGIIVDGYPFTIGELGEVTGERELADNNSKPAGEEVPLKKEWGEDSVRYYKTEDGTEVKEITKEASVTAISGGNGDIVPVPKQFYYVGGTTTSGVVISDNEADKDKYKGKDDVGKELKGNQFVWIPCGASDYKKYNWGDSYKNRSWDTDTQSSEMTQIEKYGGFYVGRYEAGTSEIKLTSGKKIGDEQLSASAWQNSSYVVENTTEDSKPTSKAGEIPYFHPNFATAKEMSKRMYNTNYVHSGLMTGTQWDVMIKFIAGDNEELIKSQCTWGNYNDTPLTECDGKYCTIDTSNGSMTSAWQENTEKKNRYTGYTLLTTGSTEEVKKKNLYDVAGNLCEWTEESAETAGISYMRRGGSLSAKYTISACYRAGDLATCTNTTDGFRVTLYIK